jgi:UDP-N-acetylmuramoyl-tripeptide--D-alanyl-D-alanine ligase
MLRRWLSRYTWRYPRSLVYMLQASEYHIRDYFHWYHRVKDFRRVEQRKHFVPTSKSLVLLAATWLVALAMIAGAIALGMQEERPEVIVLSIVALLLIPFLLPYLLLVPLLLIKWLIQYPTEYFIGRATQARLKAHPGLKIAVAGSFGKTSMREILTTVLAEEKVVVAPSHNYNTLPGISQFTKTLSGKEEVLVFELGEYYPGDVKKLCQLIQPSMGVITGINEAHLQRFKTLTKTAATIYELADYLGDRPLYINGDSELALQHGRPGNIVYTSHGVGQWLIEDQHTDLSGTSFVIKNEHTTLALKSQLLGLHQIGPLAAAVAIASSLGLTAEQIRNGISKTKPFDHRLEPRTDSAGVITLDDSYNGNPNGVKAVIDFLAGLTGHRRFYVTPGLVEMGSQTKIVHQVIGRQLANAHLEVVILIKNSVTPFIAQGLEQEHFAGKLFWFDDALQAFAALPQLTVSGDIVLLQNDWPDQYQ